MKGNVYNYSRNVTITKNCYKECRVGLQTGQLQKWQYFYYCCISSLLLQIRFKLTYLSTENDIIISDNWKENSISNVSNKFIQEFCNRQQLVLSTTSANPVRNFGEFWLVQCIFDDAIPGNYMYKGWYTVRCTCKLRERFLCK